MKAIFPPHRFNLVLNLACQLTCTGLIKNVIGHYCFKGSSVFGCFLDASKAFDRVSHLKLFNRLLEKNLPPISIRHADCSSPGTKIKSPVYSGIKPFLRNFQF